MVTLITDRRLRGVEHWTAMKAPRLNDGAVFAPGAVKAMANAFEMAWAEIAGNFGNDQTRVETARTKLADAVLSVASEDSRDVEALRREALQAMAMDYRSGIDRSPGKT